METTFTNNLKGSNKLTLKDLKRGIKLLEENSKKPFLVCIFSRLNPLKLLKKEETMNVPVYQDKKISKDIFRFQMSDGTYQDISIEK